jgi:hypothetical protein
LTNGTLAGGAPPSLPANLMKTSYVTFEQSLIEIGGLTSHDPVHPSDETEIISAGFSKDPGIFIMSAGHVIIGFCVSSIFIN